MNDNRPLEIYFDVIGEIEDIEDLIIQ